jgi:hypothetical protein
MSSLITDWEKVVPILSAMLTPAIALLATYIAWQQHKTNRDHFRLGLFERRSKLFDSAGKLIGTVLGRGRVTDADLKEFLWDTKESGFLFGSDIKAYLDELYGKASDVFTLENPVDEEQRKQRRETLLWFSGQGDELKKKFGKYMAFRENEWKRWSFAALIILVIVAIGIYAYVENHAPQRVFLTHSQRFQNDYGVKSQDDIVEDDSLEAEQRLSWLMSGNSHCLVLTHDRKQANYVVEITVERHPASPISGHFGDATVSITKRNGDVVLIDSFYQDRNSADDIAQQPITKVWEVLCSKSKH